MRPAIFLAALALLVSFGCAKRVAAPPPAPVSAVPAEPVVAPPSGPASVSPAEPVAPPPPPPAVEPADRAHASGVAAMAEGNYERALEAFTAAWKESPGHPGVARDFPDALTGLKKSGDEAFRQGRLDEAGRRWSAALRHLSHPAEKGKPLPFTKAELQASIDKVSVTLMEKGLVEYRKGNLEAAIGLWKSILAYDPSHAEAARSVQTAATQLENLKKINPQK
jgi:tetratricopeptide (TPR) repeat protein